MHEHGLAKELWPQLKRIAEKSGFRGVSRVEMLVGSLHGVSAEFLAHSFEHAFGGTIFQGAVMNITLLEPGDPYSTPTRRETVAANGWELLITRIEGEK